MASLLGARRRHSDLEALPISSVARRRLPHLSPNSARAKLRTHEITRGVVPPVWSGVSDSSGESRGNLTARGSSPIITTARGRAPIPPPPSVPLPGPSPRSVSTDGYHSAPAPGEASGGSVPAEEHPDDVECARRSVAAAVETAMASARERPVSEFLDEMEDRITGMMDVGAEYRTPFASPAFAAQDLEHTQQLLCKRVVAAADNHVVFDPDINDPDDGVSIFLTVVKADHLRRLAELELQDMRTQEDTRMAMTLKQPQVDQAFQSFRASTEHAFDRLPPTDPLRLHCALKFAMFCSEVLQQPRLAFETAEQAYTAASAALPRLPQDQLEDVAPLLQRLRDRVSHWSSEVDLLGDDDDGLDNVSVDDGVPATEDHDARQRRLPPPSDSQGDASSTRRRSEELLPEGLTLGKQTTPRVRRPFSPVSTVITESRQSPRQWLSALRSRRRRERGRSARQGGAVRAHRMAGRMRKKLHSRRRARAAQGGSGSDSDSGSSSGSEDSTAVNLGQVEMVLSMMPRGDSVVLSAFEDAVNVVPPLHEIFSRYSPHAAASGRRVAGGVVAFMEEAKMDINSLAQQAGRQEQLLPEEDFRRFLRDFKVVPKLLNDTDITVMLRMTLRGFPSVLIRMRKRRGFVARRRSSVFAASGNFDSASLIEDDAGSLQLTYAQYLDVLGRVAVVAFAQPPYRNRYDNTKDRIRGFFVDYLGVTGKRRLETARGAPDGGDDASAKSDWRAMMSARQPAVKVPKKGQRDRSDESGPFGNDFKLTTSSRALLRGAGVQRALQCLFEFYRKSIQPHGSKVLFSDIAEGNKLVDIGEVNKFTVDFGFVPALLSGKDVEALYRAQQRMGRHLGRGSKLGKADKRRELASAQATALSFQGFQTFLVRLAEQARFQLMHAGGGELTGQADKQKALLDKLGLPRRPTKHDADEWWAATRNNLVGHAHGRPQALVVPVGRPLQWGATSQYVTPTGLHRPPGLSEILQSPAKGQSLGRVSSAPTLVTGDGPQHHGMPRSNAGGSASTPSLLRNRSVWTPSHKSRSSTRVAMLRKSGLGRSRKPLFDRVEEEPNGTTEASVADQEDGPSVSDEDEAGAGEDGGELAGKSGHTPPVVPRLGRLRSSVASSDAIVTSREDGVGTMWDTPGRWDSERTDDTFEGKASLVAHGEDNLFAPVDDARL